MSAAREAVDVDLDAILLGIRRALERADFMFHLIEGTADDDGPWVRVRLLAILDAGLDALQGAIDLADQVIAERERRKIT